MWMLAFLIAAVLVGGLGLVVAAFSAAPWITAFVLVWWGLAAAFSSDDK